MDMEGLVAFAAGFLFNEARAKTLDLHPGAGLLLDILHEDTLQHVSRRSDGGVGFTHLRTDNLCTNIEVAQRFEVDGQLDLRPFALSSVSIIQQHEMHVTHPFAHAILLVLHEGAKVCVDQVINLVHRLLQRLLRVRSHVKVEGRVPVGSLAPVRIPDTLSGD